MPVTPSTHYLSPTAPAAEPNASVTCARDGRTHVVTHAVLAESLTSGAGCCTAVCGHVVLPASLASPPGERCVLCTEDSDRPRREPRRRPWSVGYRSRGGH